MYESYLMPYDMICAFRYGSYLFVVVCPIARSISGKGGSPRDAKTLSRKVMLPRNLLIVFNL